jgi:uncharacterized protein YjbI with pentapeptide repeats
MTTGYANYQVSVKNENFTSSDGRTCRKTALISIYTKKGEILGQNSFGVIDPDTIYEMISSGSQIVLDEFYIADFSLSAYRLRHNIDKKEPVIINGFSARNAFFEGRETIDFSYASFKDGNKSFEGTHFGKGKVIFTGATFGNGNVVFSNTYFRDGNIEFTGSAFGDGDFIFRNAVLRDGRKDFQDIHFGKGEVSFANTEFNSGELLFINTKFNSGKFDFRIARISSGKVDFHYSVFQDGEINFERAEFGNSRVDFRTVDFGSGKVNFNRTVFGDGEVDFEGACASCSKFQFKRAVMGTGTKNFNLMEMEGTDLYFERTEFGGGDVSFYESKLRSLSLKSCHLDHYFDLRIANADLLDISDTIVRDIIDLEPYDFPVNIQTLDMSGMRLPGKIYISWKNNSCKKIITNQEGTTYRQKAEQFRILKENFNGTGKYEDEDNAYVMFKRYEAKSWLTIQQEKGPFTGLMAHFPHGFQWLVFDKIGLYATAPGRVLFSVFIFWLIFGLLFFTFEITGIGKTMSSVGNPDQLSSFLQSFYHSAITFFTIGYGDVYPQGCSRILSGIEGFIGVFMMSYFTVAFVRKVLR